MKKSFGEKLKSLFSKGSSINDDFYDELTDMLVEGDIGAKTAFELVDELQEVCTKEKIRDQNDIIAKLRDLLLQDVKAVSLEPEQGKQNVWMNSPSLWRRFSENSIAVSALLRYFD